MFPLFLFFFSLLFLFASFLILTLHHRSYAPNHLPKSTSIAPPTLRTKPSRQIDFMSSEQVHAWLNPSLHKHPSESSVLTFWSVSPNVFLTSVPGVEPKSKKVKMPHTRKIATDKGKAKSTDHASPESSSIGDKAQTERESANHTTASDSTGGNTESEPRTSRRPSEATVASGAGRGPSGSEQASGTNNTTGCATILRNDTSNSKSR